MRSVASWIVPATPSTLPAATQQRLAEHVHVAQFAVLREDTHVEALHCVAARKLDQPAAERASIVLMDQAQDRGGLRAESRGLHAQNAKNLARAEYPVAAALPLPAADARDPLRARQLLRQVAAGRILVTCRLVRGVELLLAARDAAIDMVEAALQAVDIARWRTGKWCRLVATRAEALQRLAQLDDRSRQAPAEDGDRDAR